MADISKITTLDGTEYNIKDATARSLISNLPANNLQNLVDGSSTGSVRGVSTSSENSSYTIGTYAFAEGLNTKASGVDSHAEGTATTASGSHSHAEGRGTIASAETAHAEGTLTTANEDSSHAEGTGTTASGSSAHAEGGYTIASGSSSHAEGSSTIANHLAQHVFGRYNIADDAVGSSSQLGNYIEIVGNGSADNARSNARTLDWNGNEWLAGSLTTNNNIGVKRDSATASLALQRSDVKVGTAPANNSTLGQINFHEYDSQNPLSFIRSMYTAGRSSQLTMSARNKTNGTGDFITNTLTIAVSNAGARTVSVTDVQPWLDTFKITPTEKTITVVSTLPSGITSIEYIHVLQSGYTVYVEGAVTRNTTDNGSTWSTLATGLPAPMIINSIPVYQCVIDPAAKGVRPLYLRITTTGILGFAYGQTSSGTTTYRFTLTYIAKNAE